MCLKVVRRLPSITQAPQTAAIRTYLRGKYAAVKLFQAREAFAPKDQVSNSIETFQLVTLLGIFGNILSYKNPFRPFLSDFLNFFLISTLQLDIGVNAGDLVGVVQQKDPLGSRDRWFVDNGQAQGFVQSRVLGPIGDTVAETEAIYAPTPTPASVPTPLRHQVSTFQLAVFLGFVWAIL